MTKQQESDFKWFKGEMADLFTNLGRCHVIVRNKEVIGVYDTFKDAISKATSLYDDGTYIVQEVGPDDSVYMVKIPALWAAA